MSAHVRYLKKYHANGTFVVSGRKIPRDGGVIMAAGDSREEIERIVGEDPFHSHGLADFRIIEFRVSQRPDDLNALVDYRTTSLFDLSAESLATGARKGWRVAAPTSIRVWATRARTARSLSFARNN